VSCKYFHHIIRELVARLSQFNFDTIMVLDRSEEEAIAYLAYLTVINVFLRRPLDLRVVGRRLAILM